MQISVMQSRQHVHLVPSPILHNPAHSSQFSDASMALKQALHCGSPCVCHLALHTSKLLSSITPNLVLHSNFACDHHLALHQSSTPFQVSLCCHLALDQSSTPFQVSLCCHLALHQSSTPFQVSLCCHLALHQSSTPFQVSLCCHLALHQSSTPFQVSLCCHLALHQSSTPFQVSLCCHLALHQSSTPFQVSLSLSPGFTPKQYSIPSQLVVVTWLYTKAVFHSKSAFGPFQVSLSLSPGFTPKQYSTPSQLVVVTWLYTKAVFHSKSACHCYLALHQSSTPFQPIDTFSCPLWGTMYHQASYWPFLVQVDQVGNVVCKLHISNHHLRVGFSGNRKI